MSNETTIYISYAGDPSLHGADELVHKIKKKLNLYNIIEYRAMFESGAQYSINKLIEDIGKNPYVIVIISERYLTQSLYCQLEIMRLEQNANIIKRVFPVFVKDLPDIYDKKIKNNLIKKAQIFLDNETEDPSYDEEEKRLIGAAYVTIKTFINRLNDNVHWTCSYDVIDELVVKIEERIHEDNRKGKNLYSSVPIIHSDYVSRGEHVEEIFELLLDKNYKKIGIWGMGGVGKTSFAIEIANYERKKKNFKDGVYFISLGQNPDIESIIGNLLVMLGEESKSPTLVKLQKTFEYLNALLIIDNVWAIKDLKSFEINAKHSKILITTRRRDIIKSFNAQEYNLKIMSEDESFKILEKKVGEINNQCRPIANELLKRCGYLPLAIDIMGAMIELRDAEDHSVWQNILNRLMKAKLDKIEIENGNEEHENLFKVIDLSVEFLKPDIKEQYLRFKIFNKYSYISKTTLESYLDEDDLFDLILALESASLLVKKRDENNKEKYQLHDLHKYYIQNMGDEPQIIYSKLIKKYIEKYSGKWHKVDSENTFFFQNYSDMCDSIDDVELKKEIAENILWEKDNLHIDIIKNAIKVLGKDELEVARLLLEKYENVHATTIDWALKILGQKNIYAKKFAEDYISGNLQKHNAQLVSICMDFVDVEKCTEFAKTYLIQELDSLYPVLILKCSKMLGYSNEIVKDFSNRYIREYDDIDSNVMVTIASLKRADKETVKVFSAAYLKQDFNTLNAELALICSRVLKSNFSQEMKKQSKGYLTRPLHELHPRLVLVCANILGKDNCDMISLAEKYMSSDFYDIDPATAFTFMDILEKKNMFSLNYAEKYLQQEKEYIQNYFIGICLDKLGKKNKIAYAFAKNHMNQNIELINVNIAQYCLSMLGGSNNDAVTYAEYYLNENKKKLINYIVPEALKILGKKNMSANNYAQRYMKQSLLRINPKIAQYCLSILGPANNDAVSYAEFYLKEDLEILKNFIIPKALRILDSKNEIANKYALKYMDQRFQDINPIIAKACLFRLKSDNEDAIRYATTYLQQDRKKLETYIIPSMIDTLTFKNDVAKDFAESYIKSISQTSVDINYHIIKSCLYLLGACNVAVQEYTEKYLNDHFDNVEVINTDIAKECVILFRQQYNRTVEEFCKIYLAQEKQNVDLKKHTAILLDIYSKRKKNDN